MKHSHMSRFKKFRIVSVILLAIFFLLFAKWMILDIISTIFMISQNAANIGDLVGVILIYISFGLFIVLFVFLANKELKKHECNAKIADEIANKYQDNEFKDVENK